MLTRIRNANNAKHETVDIPASNMKKSIAEILLSEGYIKGYNVIDDGKQGIIRITLKYNGKHNNEDYGCNVEHYNKNRKHHRWKFFDTKYNGKKYGGNVEYHNEDHGYNIKYNP